MITAWMPVTYGEELFLNLYEELGEQMRVTGPKGSQMEYLVNFPAFETFAKLSATCEVFLRCVRCAIDQYRQGSSAPAIRFAQAARRELDLPSQLLQNQKFAERLKQVGRIASEQHRDRTIEANATRNEPNQCYLCGETLTKTGHSTRTIEHLWPLSLGGETVENNLILACNDCNSKRGHMMTWACGPVHSTYYTYSSNNPKTKNPPADLRLSLALARLMQAAAPMRGRREPRTLKEAAQLVRPAILDLDVQKDRPYVYFELLQEMREPA